MFLADLIKKAKECSFHFSTGWIPLKYEGQDVEINFAPEGDNDKGWVINLKIEKK